MAEPKTATAAPPATGEPVDDPLWDDWDTPPRIDPVPVLHLEGFDGPMDLLLDLAERQRIDLGRLSVVALAAQFLAATERLVGQVPIERRAEWLVLATRLVLLRSRLLFPATKEAAYAAEAEAAREVARLQEMQFIRAAVAWMERRPQLGRDVFSRPARGPDLRADHPGAVHSRDSRMRESQWHITKSIRVCRVIRPRWVVTLEPGGLARPGQMMPFWPVPSCAAPRMRRQGPVP